MKKTKKKSRVKMLDIALGAGARLQYLDENPHGLARVTKVHKSKKTYSRKKKKNFNEDSSFFFCLKFGFLN